MTEDSGEDTNVCRVCRSESTAEKPLFHPCLCRGSIKYVHQDCLTQWLKYSRKELCELCNHKYTFKPIYHPDMPKRLPFKDFIVGIFSNLARAVQCWIHYTVVALAWLGAVPLAACRIYRCLFSGSLNALLNLPFEMFCSENLFSDCLTGMLIMALTLCSFVALVWLREQIIHGGPLNWMNFNNNNNNNHANHPNNNDDNNNNNNDNVNNNAADEQDGDVAMDDENDENNAGQDENQVVAQEAVVEDIVVQEDNNQQRDNNGVNENVVEQQQNGNVAENEREGDDANWQPFEWAPVNGEELTWERLLGLDGSLVFLEHVFWVITLNALFLVVFAFVPFHVGTVVIRTLKIKAYVEATLFDRLVTALIGYLFVAVVLYVLQCGSKVLKFRKVQRVFSMCYLTVKVFWLVLMEIGLFPLICGFWLDVCSLLLFSGSFRDRVTSFKSSPGTSAFLHWLVGMIYVFYFASFVLLLREVLRPGVLWFLQNLNDPDFNPIQEMIQFPVYRHIRRFVASVLMFGVTILIIVYYPIRIIMNACPTVLPYNIHLVSLNSTAYLNIETSLSELSLELLLLQVVLPALLEQSHARHALKLLIKGWCLAVSKLLGLQNYLLPSEPEETSAANGNVVAIAGAAVGGDEIVGEDAANLLAENENDAVAYNDNLAANNRNNDLNQNEPPVADDHNANRDVDRAPANDRQPAAAIVEPIAGANLGAEHQALLLGGRSTTSFQPYNKPTFFFIRIVCLLLVLASSALVASLICLTIPVTLGRSTIYLLTGHRQVHELYTLACGLYECWLFVRLSFLCSEYLPWGFWAVVSAVKFWAVTFLKCCLVAVSFLFVIPLLFGILFQLVLVVPLRVNINQSPLFFPWQDWAMGILHCKILCALIMMGPDWRIKRVFDRIYQDGFRNMSVKYIYTELIIPVIVSTGLTIAVPYVTAFTIAPLLGLGEEEQILFQRHIYPSLLIITLTMSFFYWQCRQVRNLLQHIRNERYLVGQRLVNYERHLETI